MLLWIETPVKKNENNKNEVNILQVHYLDKLVFCY